MNPREQVLVNGRDRDQAIRTDRPSVHDFAMLEEVSFTRREAQAEADLAYADWRVVLTADAYAVYRAAQDRADAAQDDLARMTQRAFA